MNIEDAKELYWLLTKIANETPISATFITLMPYIMILRKELALIIHEHNAT